MLTPLPDDSSKTDDKPFMIEHLRLGETPVGFTPAARLVVTPVLRTSGLLKTLSDEAARSLLLLLTFLSPNGHIQPATTEISAALHLSERQARDRMRRLAAVKWHGEPLVVEVPRENGMIAFALSPAVVENRAAPRPSGDSVDLPIPASREAVIAHSRATYATPRAEAERLVAEQLGLPPGEIEDTPEGEARRKLYAYGVPRDVIERLIADYPLDRIQRQIDWLPRRNAKSPGRFLMAAIEGDYDPPVRRRDANTLQPVSITPADSNLRR